ncbi:MAG: Ppx/GppA family phosphatase [Myxococcota bacterium]
MIDLGSNTTLLLVMDREGRVLCDQAKVTRLGEGVFGAGALSGAARERCQRVVRVMAQRARSLGCARVVAVGTAALRSAADGPAFVSNLVSEGTLDAGRVISGDEEATLTLEAPRRAAQGRALSVIDVGGGSTEICWGTARGEARGVSLPLGSVRLTEACVRSDPATQGDLDSLRAAIARALPGLEPALRDAECSREQVVAVAGTATTLAALDLELEPYEGSRVESHRLTAPRLREWIGRLAALDHAARCRLAGMDPGRADILLAGTTILERLLVALGARECRVSERGVRHGLALRLLAGTEALW